MGNPLQNDWLGLHTRPTAPRYLDQLLDGTLLCKPGVAKVVQASEEGGRAKKLIGALRYLFRNSA